MNLFVLPAGRLPLCRLLSGLTLGFLLLPGLALGQAQEESVRPSSAGVRIGLGGTLQPRISYAREPDSEGSGTLERFGFGFRRARLRLEADVAPRAGFYLQIDAAGEAVSTVDAYAFYDVNDRLRLRFGRFASAQPLAFVLTSHTRIDAVDRAAVAERWGARTIGSDGRDFGLDARYQFERGELLFFLHAGDGSWSRLRGNFRESISGGSATGGVERTGMAVSLYGQYAPGGIEGLDAGGFVGYNGARNPNTQLGEVGRAYASYAAHLYWGPDPGSQPVRLKADLIGVRYERAPAGAREVTQHLLGLSVLGAVGIGRAAEVFGRFEHVDNVDADERRDRYLTAGASFSPSALRGQPYARERLTLAYSVLLPEDDAGTQHLFVLQAQIVF